MVQLLLHISLQCSGVEIPLVISTRDLGILISDTLSWSDHIHLITSKAYKMLGLIRRSFSDTLSVFNKKSLYISLVRSHLLYCSVIWRPHLSKYIKLFERVQRRASKYLLNDYSSDYKSRLISLKPLPLSMVMELNDILFFLRSPTSILLLISLTMLVSVHQTLVPPQVTSSITLIVLLHFPLTFILSDYPVFGIVCLFLTKRFLRRQLYLLSKITFGLIYCYQPGLSKKAH